MDTSSKVEVACSLLWLRTTVSHPESDACIPFVPKSSHHYPSVFRSGYLTGSDLSCHLYFGPFLLLRFLFTVQHLKIAVCVCVGGGGSLTCSCSSSILPATTGISSPSCGELFHILCGTSCHRAGLTTIILQQNIFIISDSPSALQALLPCRYDNPFILVQLHTIDDVLIRTKDNVFTKCSSPQDRLLVSRAIAVAGVVRL